MDVNRCHVNSDVQNQDKAFGMIFKMIRQCITVLRQNGSLRHRHLSNRHLKLQNAYSCVITIWMWHDERFSMPKGKRTPSKTLIGSQSIKNDVITWLRTITVIKKTLIKKWVQDDLLFNKRQYKCIYLTDSWIRYCSIQNFVRRTICK